MASIFNPGNIMKIAASSGPNLFQPFRQTIYIPHEATPLSDEHTDGLIKAVSQVVGKKVGPVAIAAGAWQLTTIPQTLTQPEITKILMNNNVSPQIAPRVGETILGLLCRESVRAGIFGVCGGALAFVVVEKKAWSWKMKWSVIIGGFIVFAVLYLLLRHYKILV
jgi:hypothetical protein